MRTWPLGGAMLILGAGPALAQDPGPRAPIQYEVSFDNAVHHEARITVTYRDIGTAPLRLQMSRSSPGRYAVHEFAKNVYSVSAVDGAGRPLPVTRTDPYGWTVAGHDGIVRFTYTLFGDRADGTYSQIDATHAHLNMPATFIWAPGFEQRPIRVRFQPFDRSWRIATQLPAVRGEANTRWAPNLQYFMDSPTELSDHVVREWQVRDGRERRTIRLAVHHRGTPADVETFERKARKVVDQLIAVFGDVPDFDYGSYTFLADYLPHVAPDGMEHRNSTILTDTRSLAAAKFDQLQTLSHEFFHAWNVERLRPAELEPFDFTRANPTPSLWFAEGFTSYYGPLAIRRAGEETLDAYLSDLSQMVNGVVNSPARRYGSPQEMSLRAPFTDAARSIDPTNPNIFLSYYPYGAVIGLALDLTLRQRFPGLTLDHYMRHLWRTHGRSERPFRPDDLRQGLADLTRDPAFANGFFAETVERSGLPDFAPLLAQAGLTVQPANAGAAWAGPNAPEAQGNLVILTRNTTVGTPLHAAGLNGGDRIVSLGGTTISTPADWTAALARYRPGGSAEIGFVQRGRERKETITFAADPGFKIVRNETIGQPLTPAQRAFRTAWLGPDSPAAPN